jgi:hemoglobin-like flavoprotein
MAEALSDKTIEIVKSTVPALEAGGTAITDRMYQLMFRNAEVRALFNQSHHGETGSQSKALTAAIIAYARNIDNLGVLASRITQKHCGLNILPEHYHYVAESLLGAIKDVLGEAPTEEVLSAWGEAYWFLADVLMAREASIYSRLAAAPGDWSGWREFAIESTKPESEVIRSFILVPKDGRRVMHHQRGNISPSRWSCREESPLNATTRSPLPLRTGRIASVSSARPSRACHPGSSPTGYTTRESGANRRQKGDPYGNKGFRRILPALPKPCCSRDRLRSYDRQKVNCWPKSP